MQSDVFKPVPETWSSLAYHVTLSQPGESWNGFTGRVDGALVERLAGDVSACRYFICGPGDMMDALTQGLAGAGVPADRIHTEAFHAGFTDFSAVGATGL